MAEEPKQTATDVVAEMIAIAIRREDDHGPEMLERVMDELETKICAAYWRMHAEEAMKL